MLIDTSKLQARIKESARGSYTLGSLVAKYEPHPPEELAIALGELVASGQATRVVRVESPGTRAGLGVFKSIAEVPDEIPDENEDIIPVTPDLLKVEYQL